MDVTLPYPHPIKIFSCTEKLHTHLVGPFIKFVSGFGCYSTFISASKVSFSMGGLRTRVSQGKQLVGTKTLALTFDLSLVQPTLSSRDPIEHQKIHFSIWKKYGVGAKIFSCRAFFELLRSCNFQSTSYHKQHKICQNFPKSLNYLFAKGMQFLSLSSFVLPVFDRVVARELSFSFVCREKLLLTLFFQGNH